MDQYIGKMLDNRYEILERIGAGGMAVVYKAKCHRLNRLVAIKILKADLAQDEDFRRRFNAESQAVAQLSHTNIMSVYDVSRGGDIEYIVMELIDGITLKQYMEKRGQLNWRESLHFITQIMRGLSHAHSRGIVHRDIKPQNIMVLRDGSVKVADFGIACLENSAQTLTQEALGSVHYISPEQAKGDRTDARSDIYSAGVVLYEMLAGRLPFEGDSPVSVAIQHLSSIPLAPREINPEIPEQLELICMKAMTADPEKRYYSAEAMIADLEAFRKNPGASLDFELEDLRPAADEPDEPTRPLRGVVAAAQSTTNSNHRGQTPAKERERKYDYDRYEDEPERGNGKRIALVSIVIILAVAVVFVMFKSILGSFDHTAAPEQFVVPSVLGETLETANELESIKSIFTLTNMGSVFSSEYAPGQIAKQSPEAGSTRKGNNLEIEVWISAGEDTGKMLDVTSLTVVQAKQTLRSLIEKYDLVIEVPEDEQVFHEEIDAGCIISTRPAVNEDLKKGDTIYMVLSKGKPTFPLPKFVGLQIDNVTAQLTTMGLEQGNVDEVFSDQPIGFVVEQDPAAQADVTEGTKINFKVSKGPENGTGEGGSGNVLPLDSDLLTFSLPMDRDTGYLKIYQDGDLVFSQTVDCRPGSYAWWVTANGETTITAYLDGDIIYNNTITVGG